MGLFETIKYDVIQKEKHIEIRLYEAILLASTKTKKDTYQSNGFNPVFNYISKGNVQKEKIAMTTPVVTFEEKDTLVTGFYVPSKYDINTVPKPINQNVLLRTLEPAHYAVITFKGRWTDHNFNKHDDILRQYIKDNGLVISSNRFIFRYQPPFIPSFFRRNEIAYQVHYIEALKKS